MPEGATEPRWVVCVVGTDGVEKGKVYRVVTDAFAREHKMIRIIDDSEEDYLFPADNFVAVTIPKSAEKLLQHSQRLGTITQSLSNSASRVMLRNFRGFAQKLPS